MEELRIATLADIEEIEKVPLEERVREKSTYELIEKGANINPEAIALSFLRDGNTYDRPQRLLTVSSWER